MALKLPPAFVERMRELLDESEFEAFLASYAEDRYYGLRTNRLKLTTEELQSRLPFKVRDIPWCPDGFYYEEEDRPGKHPYYHAGLYYIQEPSAMAPVELLDVQPGERVLDLCAAPGGKTTQIAGKLQGRGLVVTNDISAERCKAILKNVEFHGIRNAAILNETPDRLAERWSGFFHKILIDAPCSGEGMFRKDDDMVRQWERHSVERCSRMQAEILEQAARLLAPGGRIVYSTCTFAPEENECRIAAFLRAFPEFRVVPTEPRWGFAPGRPDWCAEAEGKPEPDAAALQTAGAVRLWPYRLQGEGHFAVVLEKAGPASVGSGVEASARAGASAGAQGRASTSASAEASLSAGRPKGKAAGRAPAAVSRSDPEPWRRFVRESLRAEPGGALHFQGEHLYLLSPELPSLDGLKTVRPGWYAGHVKRDRFLPSHALAMGITADDALRTLQVASDSDALIRYLRGETLFADESELTLASPDTSPRGYVLVCVDRFPVGWGKWADGTLKNEYPPAWRRI